MWGRKRKPSDEAARPQPLKEALRELRLESAERTGVILEMRDAEAARLDLLNEALDPVFADVPAEVEIFDRGVSRGDVPKLWIDVITFVMMGRDKRTYRLVPRRVRWVWRAMLAFVLGFIGGVAALILVALLETGG